MQSVKQNIRSGDITREEGVALVKRFDHESPGTLCRRDIPLPQHPGQGIWEAASEMFEQPVLDREYFMKLADTFRSPHLWKWEDGQWKLRHAVWHG